MTHRMQCTLLSFVVPGWGQFEQQRPVVGSRFLATALVLVGALPILAIFRLAPGFALLDLLLLTLWTAGDAWHAGGPPGSPRA